MSALCTHTHKILTHQKTKVSVWFCILRVITVHASMCHTRIYMQIHHRECVFYFRYRLPCGTRLLDENACIHKPVYQEHVPGMDDADVIIVVMHKLLYTIDACAEGGCAFTYYVCNIHTCTHTHTHTNTHYLSEYGVRVYVCLCTVCTYGHVRYT
jgi:hypothetical protein